MVDPFQALTEAQRRATELAAEAFNSARRAGTAAFTQPEDAYQRIMTLISAVGDLAASSTKPIEAVIANQRTLSRAMANFAALQADMAEVVAQLAASHAAVLDAMEALAGPALVVSDLIRSDPTVKKAQKKAKDEE
ncbi:MAG: hypothetical protein ACTHOG_03030 [Marmoricola sp.]